MQLTSDRLFATPPPEVVACDMKFTDTLGDGHHNCAGFVGISLQYWELFSLKLCHMTKITYSLLGSQQNSA